MMKKLIYAMSVLLPFMACKKEAPRDYVSFSGTISNQNSDSLLVSQRKVIKRIHVNPDGTFSDTLKIETGNYTLFDGTEQTSVYLKNGYDLKISLDTRAFDETIRYEGMGAEANNYLAKKLLLTENIFGNGDLFGLDETGFNEKLGNIGDQFRELLGTAQNTDSSFINAQEKNLEGMLKQLRSRYAQKQVLKGLNGQESSKFVDYMNIDGGSTSLEDLRGAYVYMDIWATWCAPCKAEIPYLEKIMEEYGGSGIRFVSISVDSPESLEKWKKMVTDSCLKGIQLFANGDEAFLNAYHVTGIPRFILLDPNGHIVSADAPRPSSRELGELFNGLDLN